MFNLIKIEWKKNRMNNYVFAALLSLLTVIVLALFTGVVSQQESEAIFANFETFEMFIVSFIKISGCIIAATIISKLIIEEYRSGTIKILFTTQTSRKKIMMAKLTIVFVFTLINISVSIFISELVIYIINNNFNILSFNLELNQIVKTVPSMLINGIMIAGISLITLFFGLRKYSIAATITSAIIISVLLNSTVPSEGSVSNLSQFIIVPMILCLIGIVIAYFTCNRINKKDVV